MIQEATVRLTGVRPLIVQSSRSIDPEDDLQKEISSFDRKPKAKKTPEEAKRIDKLRWLCAVYFDDETRQPILPAANFHKCLIEAGRTSKLGKSFEKGVSVLNDSSLGVAKPIDELVNEPNYVSRHPTARGVVAVRPIFPEWTAEFQVIYEDAILSQEDFLATLYIAGKVGVGTWRQLYGKFEAEIV
jgi:hypothetical protein